MIFFDEFFIVIYNFCNKTLKRCKDDARLSALAFLVTWLTFLLMSMSNVVGLLKNNKYSYFIVSNSFTSYVCIGIFLYVVFGIRYYKIYDAESFQERFYSKSKQKQKLSNYLVLLTIVLVLVLFFCTARLYKFGHI